MALIFPGEWRFFPPMDGRLRHSTMAQEAIWDFRAAIDRIAPQLDRWSVLEHFKSHFGFTSTSSSASWADSDLNSALDSLATNPPLFIEAFVTACQSLQQQNSSVFVPGASIINGILARHSMGYEVRGDQLVLTDGQAPPIPVSVAQPTLAESARTLISQSLLRSEELLAQGRAREAVQEILWVLESVSTAFRGMETESGTVHGKYFNQIIRDLRSKSPGTTLERALEWATNMHGFLSSPTGGGVRHGLDLKDGVSIDVRSARLFCNLTRSYIAYLLEEERLVGK